MAQDQRQNPCPHRIIDDCGSAFTMGCVGGSIWHFAKGVRNSPKGDRFAGGRAAMAMRAPTLGGAFAVWGGLFATFDCTYAYLRHREDPLNAIAAGATTGGVLAMRAGYAAMARNALVGGVLLGVIEGLGIMVQYMLAPQETQQQVLPPPSTGVAGKGQDAPKSSFGGFDAEENMLAKAGPVITDDDPIFDFGESSDDDDL